MERELKEKILRLKPTRSVPVDVPALANIGEGEPHLYEGTFPHVEVPQIAFDGKVYKAVSYTHLRAHET